MKKIKHFKWLLLGVGSILGLTLASLLFDYQQNFRQGRMVATEQEFVVAKGETFHAITQRLHDAGYLRRPLYWTAYAYLNQQENLLKAGHYQITPTDTPLRLFHKMVRHQVVMEKLTVVNGWNIAQVLQTIEAQTKKPLPSYPEIAQRLGILQASPEGWIYPDTYLFAKGTDGLKILEQGHATMQQKLGALWVQYPPAKNSPIQTPYQALILASIVEKEAYFSDEKPIIAGVFLNRLNKKMRLQSDPTVIYGMGKRFQGNLRKKDLQEDTPYNTYIHKGLPPTPISMPDDASLRSVLNPAATDALYFVANKHNKKHYFSKTYEEHRQAVYEHQIRSSQ